MLASIILNIISILLTVPIDTTELFFIVLGYHLMPIVLTIKKNSKEIMYSS